MINIDKDESFSEILSRFDDGSHKSIAVGAGWSELVKECHKRLSSFDPHYKVLQIKEKFGGLRYYFSPSVPVYTNIMHDRIIELEKKSFTICEVCGSSGRLRKTKQTNWNKTLCDKHADKEKYDDAVQPR